MKNKHQLAVELLQNSCKKILFLKHLWTEILDKPNAFAGGYQNTKCKSYLVVTQVQNVEAQENSAIYKRGNSLFHESQLRLVSYKKKFLNV
jgi:hypothetical protein